MSFRAEQSEAEERPKSRNDYYRALHLDVCCYDHLSLEPPGDDLNTSIEKFLRTIFRQGDDADAFNEDLWRHNARKIFEGVEAGIGTPINNILYGDDRLDLMQRMRKNVFTYAAFKGHNERTDVINALKDADGKLKAWPEFRDDALKISRGYNVNWLQAEYQSAIGSAQMAERWLDVQRQADALPWLTYYTQQDDKVRPVHRALDGITKRVEDPFWDEYYPPNGWRCRCYVLQKATGEETDTTDFDPTDREVPPAFRHNPGKDGKLWSDDHEYYDVPIAGARSIRSQMRDALVKEDIYDVVYQDEKTQATVEAHVTHDNPDERNNNIAFARLLAKQGKSIQLLPWGNTPGQTYPDMKVKGTDEVIEYKNFHTSNPHNIIARVRKAWYKQVKENPSAALAINLSELTSRHRYETIIRIFDTTEIRILYVQVNDVVTRHER